MREKTLLIFLIAIGLLFIPGCVGPSDEEIAGFIAIIFVIPAVICYYFLVPKLVDYFKFRKIQRLLIDNKKGKFIGAFLIPILAIIISFGLPPPIDEYLMWLLMLPVAILLVPIMGSINLVDLGTPGFGIVAIGWIIISPILIEIGLMIAGAFIESKIKKR